EEGASVIALLDQGATLVNAPARGGQALVVFLFGQPRLGLVAVPVPRAPLERDASRLHLVQHRLDVGLAPRSFGVNPAGGRGDEVIGGTGGAADGVAVLTV